MNFNELMAKMRELDAPEPTSMPMPENECGDMPAPMNSPMNSMSKPDAPPPSMSLNLNAQGMDNIEQLMKLMTKVNPDMAKPSADMPSMAPMPSITTLSPLKMLPDIDNEPQADIPKPDMMNKPHMEPDGDEGPKISGLDRDGDGDHDMDDHDAEKKKGKEDEAFMNAPEGGSDTDTKDVSDVIMRGHDIHRPKGTYPKVAGGDNPMQRTQESEDLRSQIRAELQRRLAEAKGVK